MKPARERGHKSERTSSKRQSAACAQKSAAQQTRICCTANELLTCSRFPASSLTFLIHIIQLRIKKLQEEEEEEERKEEKNNYN